MSPTLNYTSIDQIDEIHARLTTTFHSGVTRPLSYRRKQLLQLAKMVQENNAALEAAIYSDLGKPKLEVTMAELGPVVAGALRAADKLEEWNAPHKPEVESWRSSWDTTIYSVPKGVCCIISPWNFPYIISLAPLVGAIAAGCAVVIKPSEVAPATSQILADLFPRYLDPNVYTIVNGGLEETTRILQLEWNHIFYTGSTHVGRIVAAAAAKNVTPLTLELGGKNPVFVDGDNTDMDVAAKRILFGKQTNSGQLCVSPDYILVPRHKQASLVASFKKAYESFWPDGPLAPSSNIGRIVNPMHHARLTDMLNRTKGKVVLGGQREDDKRLAPTVVADVTLDDVLMEDEIFGPIMSIIAVDDIAHALKIINGRPHALVVYVFTESEDTKQTFLERTNSGTLVLNDTFQQLAVYEMPFGGHGESGYGSYMGKFSFDTFCHKRSFMNVPVAADPSLRFRYPPYTEQSYEFLVGAVKSPIPEQ